MDEIARGHFERLFKTFENGIRSTGRETISSNARLFPIVWERRKKSTLIYVGYNVFPWPRGADKNILHTTVAPIVVLDPF